MKKLTKSQLDDQILDHADEIIRLMKLKGWRDLSSDRGLSNINIEVWENGFRVKSIIQDISTKKRKN